MAETDPHVAAFELLERKRQELDEIVTQTRNEHVSQLELQLELAKEREELDELRRSIMADKNSEQQQQQLHQLKSSPFTSHPSLLSASKKYLPHPAESKGVKKKKKKRQDDTPAMPLLPPSQVRASTNSTLLRSPSNMLSSPSLLFSPLSPPPSPPRRSTEPKRIPVFPFQLSNLQIEFGSFSNLPDVQGRGE